MKDALLTRSLLVAIMVLFMALCFTLTAPAQEPVGKIIKMDFPQSKIDPKQTRAILESKMLNNIKIVRLAVEDPQSKCIGGWNAALVNPNNSDLTFAVEVYQFDSQSGQWHSVGPAKSVQLAKNMQTSLNGQWERRAHAQKLKLSIKRSHTVYKEHEITLPPLPSPNVEITGIDITDTEYNVNIMNKDAAAQCFLGRQCYKMTAQTGPTSGGLGGGPIKLPGSSTIISNGHPSAGWKAGVNFIRCDVRDLVNDTVVVTKTVPINQ